MSDRSDYDQRRAAEAQARLDAPDPVYGAIQGYVVTICEAQCGTEAAVPGSTLDYSVPSGFVRLPGGSVLCGPCASKLSRVHYPIRHRDSISAVVARVLHAELTELSGPVLQRLGNIIHFECEREGWRSLRGDPEAITKELAEMFANADPMSDAEGD